MNKALGGFWEQVFLSFSRKKARFIFVFLIFLIVKFFDFLGGFFKFPPRKTPVISLKIPRCNSRAGSTPASGTKKYHCKYAMVFFDYLKNAINKVAITISAKPINAFLDNFSLNTINENATDTKILNLSIGTTTLTIP